MFAQNGSDLILLFMMICNLKSAESNIRIEGTT